MRSVARPLVRPAIRDVVRLTSVGGHGQSPEPSHVQGNSLEGSGTTIVLTLLKVVASGDLVAGVVFFLSTQSLVSITDDKGNTYTTVDSITDDGGTLVSFYLANITNGPQTITATFNTSTGFSYMGCDEYSNVALTSPLDAHSIQYQNSPGSGADGLSSNAATTLTNGDLVYGATIATSGNTVTAGTGFTQRLQTADGEASEDLIQSAAGNIAATFTTTTPNALTAMMAFKPRFNATAANFYSFDGYSSPIIASPTAVYSSTTGKTWLTWEGTSGSNRIQEVRTIDSSSNESPIYTAGTNTLSGDVHGVGTIAYHEASGHAYIFYGTHSFGPSNLTNLQIATSTNSNDPSAWTASSLSTTTYGAFTFPRPVVIGNTLYLFYCTSGTGSSDQEAIAVITASINASTGALTWSGTRQVLFDIPNGWILSTWSASLISGKIWFSWNYSSGGINSFPVTNAYLAYYDPATGNVGNFGSGTVVVPGSQPIGLTSMQANFNIYSSTNSGQPIQIQDGNGVMHVILVDNTLTDTPIIEIHNSGSGWSAPFTVASFTGSAAGNYVPILNAAGGIDVYYTDGTFPGTSSFATGGGNVLRRTLSLDGTWSAPVTILDATTFPLSPMGVVDPVQGPVNANGRIVFGESSLDGTTQSGILRSYLYGDSGFLH